MIPVTKPFLPPMEEYTKLLEGVWKRQWLTNMGPLASDLEIRLKEYLNINHLIFVTNGTIALQMAIKALDLTGEIITTPFSFVATTSTIVWEGCTPVFVDIDKDSLCIDPTKIEEAITDKTQAILATHVYGNPCDVDAIDKIAKKYNLKVIYDGAHAFGVKINGKSVFEFGDITTCSLHATKLFHTVEGGFATTNDPELLKKMASIRNFGISGPESFDNLGINGKNSEFHAAMGLVNLRHIDYILERRKDLATYYDKKLINVKAVKPKWNNSATENYPYYVILLESEELLLKIKKGLDDNEIFTRRYFYPSLANTLPYLKTVDLQVTDSIAKRALCLPFYVDLTEEEIDLIARLILRYQNN
ncbi:dTDP-4-amino-4,6-dideoxygalactose transaminase [Chryseobacterium sp. SORGH_AS 447]|uniref:DegT/DnrJ/EryC1/StrS family aminotransferase n=1 Tax=Chryseobacterium sp. SORGH_AS_0447 TaxID=3041769 RepID=UPI002783E005|nr:DegT/DnrJ/EryC1/StrS family aminotransferase [Chryseobacterium sp. SORGH_AS_0447]MDQ1161011.1 dTDP-4-amino-4,6-dideoxygalactose transaminase [Chryseobacterium sp. SORGH_AS_0447]